MATTFHIDAQLDDVLESLRLHYGARSKADILRKAVAMLDVARRHSNLDGNLTLLHEGKHVVVAMRRESAQIIPLFPTRPSPPA